MSKRAFSERYAEKKIIKKKFKDSAPVLRSKMVFKKLGKLPKRF